MHPKLNRILRHCRLFAFAGALAPAAFAQTTPAPAKELPPVTLDVFTVSGEKVESYQTQSVQMGAFRDMNPVDVPLTVDVLTREVLDAQLAKGLYDALRNTAGVTMAQITTSAYSNLAIRGIVVENRGNFRLNGSLPIINLADISMDDKERVEVLKGTSSLYYGFIPPSGVINLVTKRPTPYAIDTLILNGNSAGGVGGAIDVSRSLNLHNEKGLIGGGIRVNASASKEATGIDNYAGHREFQSVAADLNVGRRLSFKGDFEHLTKNVTEQDAIGLPAAVAGVITLPAIPSTTQNLGSDWMRYNAFMTNWWTRADFLITPNWTVFAEAGNARTHRYRLYNAFAFTNLATGAGNETVSYYPGQDYRNSNYRFETYGRFLTGPVRHDLDAGVTGNTRASDAPQQGTITFATNYFAPIQIPYAPAPISKVTHVPTRILDYGYYATDRLSAFNEKVQLIIGGRETEYISTTATTSYVTKNQFDPLISGAFKPTADSSVYFSYLKGLEAGGNAPAGTTNAGSILPPLTSKQYEVGAKDKLFGGLLVQLGAFQIERPSTFTDPATNTFAANGLARFRGFEMFTSGEVTKNLSLIVSAQDLDARQTKALNALTQNKTPEGTPRYTGSLFGEYKTAWKGFNVSAGAYYVGRRPVNSSDQAYIGGYTTFSIGASYRFKVKEVQYTLRVTGDNLTDKAAWAAAGSSLLGVTAPRLFKFSIAAGF